MITKELDLTEEWIDIVKEAMNSAVTKEDFKKYLEGRKKEKEEI